MRWFQIDWHRKAHSGLIFGEEYNVVPNVAHGARGRFSSLAVDIGFDNKPGEHWKPFTGHFPAADVKLSLLDFFDWTELSWRDFRYYRVRIHKFESEPTLVGRDAIVENLNVDVLWESSVIIGGPANVGTPRVIGGSEHSPFPGVES